MPYSVPDFASIRTDLLRDLANQRPELDLGPDSDYFVRATSVASVAEGIYKHQQWITRQIFPDTADAEYLELHAATRSLKLKSATAAAGGSGIVATGVAGEPLPAGLTFTLNDDGRQYMSTAAVVIDGLGQVNIPARALIAGAAGNAAPGTSGTFVNAPAVLDSTAVIGEMVGGVDRELHESLLIRLLELIRRPPAGGNKYDYRRWALEVPGVEKAYVYPLRRGLGTVDVAITTANALPSPETVVAAQEHIDDVRPVTAKNSLVFAPEEVFLDLDIEVHLVGVTLVAATPLIEAALAAQFNQIAPAETWTRSKSEAIISAVLGVEDRRILAPVDNVVPTIDGTVVQWLRLGAVTVTAMA